ncbi:long-chain-fatty-acid--CoA ligase [Vulcanisaeta thermophila]|uniref:long-chain-fatty-acid--CoA ligase n=1 Tax=Vulcanisaeta thermophila TaxID=867917 RepID=UPI0008530F70|nr:long-chain-fatty-acid--CoA ligase [Vulcanisaeta thermophila]
MPYYNYQLTLDKILTYAERVWPSQEIVYRDLRRYRYREFADNVKRLVTGLRKLGVKPGDKIGVLDWDTDVYLMLYYAVPMSRAVIHTVNIRYPPELIAKTILHAEDKYLVVRDEFLPILEKFPDFFRRFRLIVYSDSKEPVKSSVFTDIINFWDLLNNEPTENFDDVRETDMATIFYTSGTTGEPKGVWFTHRDLILHAMANSIVASIFRDENGEPFFHPDDVYLILVPLFHVHSWGYPHFSILTGRKYIMPGRYEVPKILELMKKEAPSNPNAGVYSAMVPTILHMILTHPDAEKYRDVLRRWKVIIGGAALPEGLARLAKSFGVKIAAGYGLSETCPVLTVAYPTLEIMKLDPEARFREMIKTGVPIPLAQVRVVDPSGKDVPWDGKTVGEIIVRTPWLTREYYKDPEKTAKLWEGDWLHTGDLAVVDQYGYLQIVDREKDAIKSGGEFIPSLLLEDVISTHPKVSAVAVVGMPHEKWGERPVAFIIPKGELTEEELREFLMKKVDEGKIMKWWIPDKFIFVRELPLTSTGKIDKKVLREQVKQMLSQQK